MSFREDIESGVLALIQEADSEGLFALIKAVGQLSTEDLDETGQLIRPYCVIGYTGSDPTDRDVLVDNEMQLDLVIGTINWKGQDERKADAYTLLELTLNALMKKAPAAGMHPLVWRGERGLAVNPETGEEVWQQSWTSQVILVAEDEE